MDEIAVKMDSMTTLLTLTFDEKQPGIATITIRRPGEHNALNTEAMAAFAAAIDYLAERDDLRVLIVTGEGEKSFCSGADITEMTQLPGESDALTMITRMGNALLKMERLPVPVIAAINGYALGGGAELAIACDLRIVDEKARLGFVHIRRGLIPGWGGGQRLMRHIGYARALDILLRSHALRPDEMMALGLANRIAPHGTALEQANNLATQITQHEAPVIRSMKAMLQAGLNQPYEAALLAERALFPPLWVGETRVRSMQEFVDGKNGKST